jgi:hypothetical protein
MQNGSETLKKLFRAHFPDSKLIDDSAGVRVSRIWVYAKAQRTGETGTDRQTNQLLKTKLGIKHP